MITVRLFAGLRALLGKTIPVEAGPHPSVRDVLQAIRRDHPTLAERLFDDQGQLDPDYILLIGGENIAVLQGLETPVDEAGELMIIPPMVGG
jgi:MoaD family protein